MRAVSVLAVLAFHHYFIGGHEPGFAPGVVGLVAHGPFVETVALGTMAFGAGSDMRRDTILRIGSQTKAVTAAAVKRRRAPRGACASPSARAYKRLGPPPHHRWSGYGVPACAGYRAKCALT